MKLKKNKSKIKEMYERLNEQDGMKDELQGISWNTTHCQDERRCTWNYSRIKDKCHWN